jgi:chromatin assembly factor 1 subunit A
MRISEHVDPNLKLEAIHDFLILSKACQQKQPNPSEEQPVAQTSSGTPRRQSLNPSLLSSSLSRREQATTGSTTGTSLGGNSESDVVQFLKRLLLVLRPRTIFRDLQYVAAFVSSDTLNDTEVGRAFLHVGLAALAWKDEVCRAMVDVADRIVARDTIKRSIRHGERNEPTILKAAEYWVVAAREGNPIAQRELASLYLTHPEVPPVTSLPLALSSEIFKNDMMWEEQEETQRGRQALCLALHWMQQAAENGDELAKMKLQERQSGRSVR